MADTLERIVARIQKIQRNAREKNDPTRPQWPMIVLTTPKGWTGPKVVDGLPVETGAARRPPALKPAGVAPYRQQATDWRMMALIS